MKRCKILLILFLLVFELFSQTNLDDLIVDEVPDCQDIAYSASILIKSYYFRNQIDSANLILNYWESNCLISEPLMRMKILHSIKESTFSEQTYDSIYIDFIIQYYNSAGVYHGFLYYGDYYFGNNNQGWKFDEFTKNLADSLLLKQTEGTLSYELCKFYSSKSSDILRILSEDKSLYATKLSQEYRRRINECLSMSAAHLSIFSGVWVPSGNASALGIHPIIGVDLGYSKWRLTYNFSMYLKFGSTSDYYYVFAEDSLFKTNYFFGGYIGFNVEAEIIKLHRIDINLLLGVGYDGFSALDYSKSDDDLDNDVKKSINSFNFNSGIGFRYYLRNQSAYIGLRTNYNIVDYVNNGGTNLKGNTFNISFIFGGFSNNRKYSTLRSLGVIKKKNRIY